jgi:hypothetical protein
MAIWIIIGIIVLIAVVVIILILRASAVADIDYQPRREINEICYTCQAFSDCGGGTDCATIQSVNKLKTESNGKQI